MRAELRRERHDVAMSVLTWVFVGIAAVCFLVLIFAPATRRHWPIIVFIALVALLGLLLVAMNIDPRTCIRDGLDCL